MPTAKMLKRKRKEKKKYKTPTATTKPPRQNNYSPGM